MIAHTTSGCLPQVLSPRGAVARQASLAPGFQVPSDLVCLLGRFAPISLAQMDGVALQDRTDTKYVFHARLLRPALAALAEQYRILEIEDVRLHRYHTLYFDTADWALYHRHHAGTRNRYKVRSRRYVDTDLSCLEVKLKTKADRTIKSRLRTAGLISRLTPEASAFVRAHLPPGTHDLLPRLWNGFSRITLVSNVRPERLTLDLSLRFRSEQRTVALPGVVIAEVKQARHAHTSDFMRLMRAHHLRSVGFSKYCIGVSLLYPDVKHNNFKAHHRLLARLMEGANHDCY